MANAVARAKPRRSVVDGNIRNLVDGTVELHGVDTVGPTPRNDIRRKVARARAEQGGRGSPPAEAPGPRRDSRDIAKIRARRASLAARLTVNRRPCQASPSPARPSLPSNPRLSRRS